MSNLLILADVTELVDKVKATCEAGIYPSVFMPNSKGKQIVLVRFDVKVMANGVRKNFGPFYSYAAAVKAKWEFKRSGRSIKTEEEQQAIIEMGALISDVSPKAKDRALPDVLKKMQINKQEHPIQEAKMQELSKLLLSIPPHRIVCKATLDIVHPETNEIHTVSVKEQRDWLSWYYKKEEQYVPVTKEIDEDSTEQEDIAHDGNSSNAHDAEGFDISELEDDAAALLPDRQDYDDPEIQAMLKRIEEMDE